MIIELEEHRSRIEVTHDSVTAADALRWHELLQLLRIVQERGCEALRLAADNIALPAIFDMTLFKWP